MGSCFENMDRKIPFDDTPRKQITCKKCAEELGLEAFTDPVIYGM